jgi:hypothetical protein
MIDNVAGMTPAPPMPIRARAAMSWLGSCAYAEASDARPNSTRLIISTRRRPTPVADHAGREQQPGEDQGVRVDRPLELALGGAQPFIGSAIVRRAHVEDRVVEDDDEQ